MNCHSPSNSLDFSSMKISSPINTESLTDTSIEAEIESHNLIELGYPILSPIPVRSASICILLCDETLDESLQNSHPVLIRITTPDGTEMTDPKDFNYKPRSRKRKSPRPKDRSHLARPPGTFRSSQAQKYFQAAYTSISRIQLPSVFEVKFNCFVSISQPQSNSVDSSREHFKRPRKSGERTA